jgi:glycosyltransferase involved in cell wall biosynthesis
MDPERQLVMMVCSHYFPHPGGVERYVKLQAQECARLGFAVRIVTHDTENLGFIEEQPPIEIYRLKCWSPLPHRRLPVPVRPGELWRVWRACRARRPALTVVHTRYYPLSLFGCLLARGSGSRLALIDHSSDYIRLGSAWKNALGHGYEHLLSAMILLFRPKVFGVAQACVRWLRRFGVRRAAVCPNSVDPQQRRLAVIPLAEIIGPLASRKVVLAVGRLVREKGVMELVEGFLRFAQRRDDYALVVIGHGELEPEIQEAARRHPGRLLFLGRQPLPVVLSCMAQAAVFVNPSNYPEGLPTILLEAGLCGAAVISTPNGGAGELIEPGLTGLLIERGEPSAIAEALQTLDADPKLRETIAARLRERIERDFPVETITKRFLFEDMRLKP